MLELRPPTFGAKPASRAASLTAGTLVVWKKLL